MYDSDPQEIAKGVESGIKSHESRKPQFETVLDRRQAIVKALSIAQKNDIVIVTGKGSEQFLILPGNTVASTNACYIWNNGPSMPIGTNGAGLSTYNTTALGGYTPAVYPHPLDTGSSSVNQYFPWKMY